jgi:hypothetical protein
MSDVVKRLQRLRADAEAQAQQLEAGMFKVYSVALDGAAAECTSARAKLFREFANELDRVLQLAIADRQAEIAMFRGDGEAKEA